MKKLSAKDILKPGADISKMGRVIEDKEELKAFVADVVRRQKEILRLKEIDYKQLEIPMTI